MSISAAPMPKPFQETLTPEKALIFRATHRLNLRWVLEKGLHENDPEKVERYQAEALDYQRVPMEALIGVACYTEAVRHEVKAATSSAGVSLWVVTRPDWYF